MSARRPDILANGHTEQKAMSSSTINSQERDIFLWQPALPKNLVRPPSSRGHFVAGAPTELVFDNGAWEARLCLTLDRLLRGNEWL